MKKGFNLEISSDLEYEGMVINVIYNPDQPQEPRNNIYKQELLAVLNQDKGIENIGIKLYAPEWKEYWDFSYKELIEILEKAKELLIQVNKEK